MKTLSKAFYVLAGAYLGLSVGFMWARQDMSDIKAGNKTTEESIIIYKNRTVIYALVGLMFLAAAYFVSKKNS